MKRLVVLLILATLGLPIYADQNFDNSQTFEDVYYGVETSFTVTESLVATDAVIAVEIENEWVGIDTVLWDQPANFDVAYTFDSTYQNVRFGIFTKEQGTHDSTYLLTDVTNTFNVIIDTLDLMLTGGQYWSYDQFELRWFGDYKHFPATLHLETKHETDTVWTSLGNINVTDSLVYYNTAHEVGERIKFKLSYYGKVNKDVAETGWNTFVGPEIIINNKDYIESNVFDEKQEIEISFTTDYILNPAQVIVVEKTDMVTLQTVDLDTLPYDANKYIYKTGEGVNNVEIAFVVFNQELNKVSISSEPKPFILETEIDDEYEDTESVGLSFQAHSNYETVKIEIVSNGETVVDIPYFDIDREYIYQVKSLDTILEFNFSVDDGYTKKEIYKFAKVIRPCAEALAEAYNEINAKDMIIDSLLDNQVIVNLYLYNDTVSVAENVFNSNQYIYDKTTQTIEFKQSPAPKFVYIFNSVGGNVLTMNRNNVSHLILDVSSYPSGAYYVLFGAEDDLDNLQKGKFEIVK